MNFLKKLLGIGGQQQSSDNVYRNGDKISTFARLDSQKNTWVGWDRKQLVRAFGQPITERGGSGDQWLGFKADGCSVTVHLVDGKVVSAEVWSS